jgi:SAM-dependent methyltransferase
LQTEKVRGRKVSRVKPPDKHVLYEKSVQNPAAEVRFMTRVYKKIRGRMPRVLREDFCGTAAVACEWVREGKNRLAYGIDLDLPTLKSGMRRNVEPMGPLASRVKLIHGDVLQRYPFKADVAGALNFSYFIFKERATMLRYMKSVYQGLAKDGLFVLDLFGGPEAQVVQEELTRYGDFTYIWDQARYNPVTGEILCYIHFKLRDGRVMRRAFTYDWRLWSIPELNDILMEAGFKRAMTYWEGTDSTSKEGNGIFRCTRRGDDSASWVAYLVGVK